MIVRRLRTQPPVMQADRIAGPRRQSVRVPCALVAVCLLAIGCADPGPTPEVQSARLQLQIGNNQSALEAAGEDKTAEGHYLRAIALDKLQMVDSAREQIAMALEQDPNDPKYQCFQMRLQLYNGKMEDADRLIKLHQQNPSSAVAAFCAFYGHEAQRARQVAEKNFEAAKRSQADGFNALKSSLAMASQAPEFQREMLVFAANHGLQEPALGLLETLQSVAPHDPDLVTSRVQTLLQLGRTDEALRIAEENYYQDQASQPARKLYLRIFEQSAPTPELDAKFANLVEQHPTDSSIVTAYANYLALSGRSSAVRTALAPAIAQITGKVEKQKLAARTVSIPLDAGDAKSAELALNEYRDVIDSEGLVGLFEGRLLFLKGEHKAAVEKLVDVIEADKKAVGTSRTLAREALRWIDTILQDGRAIQHLNKVTQQLSEEPESKEAGDKSPEPGQNAPNPCDATSQVGE